MANLGIIAYEAFFSFIDKDDTGRASRELTVKFDNGYAQVFQAKSTQLESVFFQADVTTSTDGGTANAEDLVVSISQLSVSGTSFVIGSTLDQTTAEDCVRLARNSSETTQDSYWYSYNCSLDNLTVGSYYAIIFTNTNTSGTTKIYFTDDYRNDVFPQIMASTSGTTPNWANSRFSAGIEVYGGSRLGSLCCGVLGNTVEEGGDVLDAGDVNIGGSDACRGYQTYLYILKTDNDVSVKFTQTSPTVATNGSTEETNRSNMSWYWYQEGSMPISNNAALLKDTSVVSRLEGASSFALFVQPDKFAPYPKLYFPETSINLKEKEIDTNVLNQGFTTRPVEGTVVGSLDPPTTGVIKNNSNDFSHDNWAHFSEKKKIIIEGGLRDPSKSVNPNFIDVSLEKESEDTERIFQKELSAAESANIRGYNNVVNYRGKYVAFSKYRSNGTLIVGDASGEMANVPIVVTDDLSSDTWDDEYMQITPSTGTHLRNCRYIGVFDVKVENTESGETLFILLQVVPQRDAANNEDHPFFKLCVCDTAFDVNGDLNFVTYESENEKPSDAFFGCNAIDECEQLLRNHDFSKAVNDPDVDWKVTVGSQSDIDFSGPMEILVNTAVTFIQCVDAIAGREYILTVGQTMGAILDWDLSLGNSDSVNIGGEGSIVLVPKDSTGILKIDVAAGSINHTISYFSLKEATTKYNLSDNLLVDPFLHDSTSWTSSTWTHEKSSISKYQSRWVLSSSAPYSSASDFEHVLTYNNTEVTIEAGKIYRLVLNVYGLLESLDGNDPADITWEIDYANSGLVYDKQQSRNVKGPYTFLEYGFLIYGGSVDRSATDLSFNVSWTGGSDDVDIYLHSAMLFEVDKKIDIDHKCARFVESSDNGYLLYTSSNHGFTNYGYQSDYSGGKFGLWKIDLSGSAGGSFDVSTNIIEEVMPHRGFQSSTGINAREREPEITYDYKYENSVYYGTTTEGDTVSYGYAEDYDPYGYVGEVFVANDLDDFREVLSGDRGQYWLLGFTYGDPSDPTLYDLYTSFPNSDLYSGWGTSRPHYHTLNRNTKVAYMVRVDDILHIWMTQYSDYHGYGHPFHIAVDTKTNITKVLRRFPIDPSNRLTDGANSNWSDSGMEATDVAGDTVITGMNVNTTSKIMCNIISGTECGDSVYISGTGLDAYYDTDNYVYSGVDEVTLNRTGGYHDCVKWLVYDKRIINEAFYYGGSDYSYQILTSIPGSITASDGKENFAIRDQFNDIESPSMGVYDGISVGKYYYSLNQREFYDYPSYKVDDSNPRVGIYCGTVCDQYLSSSFSEFGLRYLDSRFNVNPRLISQGGVAYLVCDNKEEGAKIYKSYGLKSDPKYWGIVNSDEDDFDLNIDYGIYVKCSGTHSSEMKRTSISNVDGIHFISGMKNDRVEPEENFGEDVDRYIGRFTIGIDKPQNMSFYYQFNYLRGQSDATQTWENDSGDDITTYILGKIAEPGLMSLVLKGATTLEKLWTEPTITNVIPFELGFDSNELPAPDFYNRFLCHHTFQSDVSDTFFRLESQKLVTPYDEGYRMFGATNDADLNYWNNSGGSGIAAVGTGTGVGVPYAEILVKGLTFSAIDLPYEDEGLDQKTVAINGIISSGSPGKIVDDGVGTEVTGDNEIVIDFPNHLFLNEVSFDVVVDENITGDSNSQFNFYYLPQSSISKLNINAVHDSDWKDMGSIGFDPADYSPTELLNGVNVELDAVNTFTKTLKIYINTGLKFKIRNLQVKTFATVGAATQFTKGNGVGNAELIIVDDIHGLIEGKYTSGVDVASYTEFKREGSYVEIDLGELKDEDGNLVESGNIPINKVSLNAIGGLGRSIKVEIKNRDSASYEPAIFDERITDYEYTIVEWSPREKTESYIIDVTLSTTIADPDTDFDPYGSSQNSDVSSNFSTYFGDGALRGFLFRPNIAKSRNVTIIDSSNIDDSTGTLQFNAQMDEYGPFGSDQGEHGVIERSIQAEFPVQDVEKVKITVYGFSDNNMQPVRINGLKVYTPIIDGDGIAVWPQPAISWNIVLRAQVISSV